MSAELAEGILRKMVELGETDLRIKRLDDWAHVSIDTPWIVMTTKEADYLDDLLNTITRRDAD